jgi:hypothetical protein
VRKTISEAAYKTSTHGSILFKSGWKKFINEFDLQVGLNVLILLHMEGGGYVKISFDVL